jgi:hypothetical protein
MASKRNVYRCPLALFMRVLLWSLVVQCSRIVGAVSSWFCMLTFRCIADSSSRSGIWMLDASCYPATASACATGSRVPFTSSR